MCARLSGVVQGPLRSPGAVPSPPLTKEAAQLCEVWGRPGRPVPRVNGRAVVGGQCGRSATSCNNPRYPVRGAEVLTLRKQDGGAEKALTLTCPCPSRAIRGEDALVLKRAEHFPTRQGLPGPRPRGSRPLQATCVDWPQPPFSGASGGLRPWGGGGLGPPSP